MKWTGMMAILLLFAKCFLCACGDTHSLQYLYTAVTPGINFPEFTAVGLLDGELFMTYSSSNRTLILKDWIKKIEDETFWLSEINDIEDNEDAVNSTFKRVKKAFNHSTGVHTLQWLYGCEGGDDGAPRGLIQWGYDGEDFIGLDLKTETWTTAKPQAEILIQWEPKDYNKYWKDYLQNKCIEMLKKYVLHGSETLRRKVVPEVSVFQKHSSPSPEVVCLATGFFPKALNITWQKDGEDAHEDVELRETSPNQDGSFQKRSILKVPAEELQKHTYTCVVHHSSLEKELVLNVSERQILKGGGPIAIITAVVAALVALVTVVAGIVVWKKKNSGFKPVSSKLSSEGDSSSYYSNSVTV